MRHSARSILLTIAIICVIALGAFGLRQILETRRTAKPVSEVSTGDSQSTRVHAVAVPEQSTPQLTPHAAVSTTTNAFQDNGVRFVLDDFRGMTAFPPAYKASGLELAGDGLSLSAAITSGTPRIGMLESAPITLNRRPRSGSESLHRNLPDGHTVDLEISLSEEGTSWTDWYFINRTTAGQADADSGMPTAAPPADDPISHAQEPVENPRFVRYRLTLTAAGDEPLLLRNVEVWQRRPLVHLSGNAPAVSSGEVPVFDDGAEIPHLTSNTQPVSGAN